jgi:hypothetical protein
MNTSKNRLGVAEKSVSHIFGKSAMIMPVPSKMIVQAIFRQMPSPFSIPTLALYSSISSW